MKTKIFSDFQICISVPLINRNSVSFDLSTLNSLIYSTVFEHITKRVHNLVLSFRSLKQKKQKAFVNILLAIKNFLSCIFQDETHHFQWTPALYKFIACYGLTLKLYLKLLSTHQRLRSPNQSIDLPCQSIDWFLYDGSIDC